MMSILVLWCAWRAYRQSQKQSRLLGKGGSGYAAITSRGVPFIACFVATDREAWRVSQRAIEEFSLTGQSSSGVGDESAK